jgi:serine/threonine protein kinase/tetratricopeptide (TPR) repeat protein
MNADRWKKIDALLDEAMERTPAERAAFLQEACGEDSELRRKVESLLRADEAAASFIEAPAAAFAAEMLVEKSSGAWSGQQFGQYKILSPLGAGGMGEVYLAEDTKLGRRVALKLLPERFTQDDERVRRFEQEGRAASALNHPNIITIHDVGRTESSFYLATEFIEGQTLRQRLKNHRMTPAAAIDLARQVAAALAAAHAVGIVHRDIKPENIMVRPDGLVKVLDFGLAKLKSTSEENDALATQASLTEPGMVMGTVSYLSPEQARGQEVDGRSDLFCLGVVMYEMIAGVRPFTGATPADVMAAILDKEPSPLSNIPARMEEIVQCALRKERDERYQTANELLHDLDALRQDLELDEHLSRRNPLLASLRRHQRSVTIVLSVLLMLAVAAFFLFKRTTPPLTDKDTVLLADFVNTTGDAVFDGALKQALAVQLEQSPYLSLFPEPQARQTLRLMNRQPGEKLTPEVAREICQRNGVKALLGGTIAPLGNHFVLTLEAVNAATGDVIARQLAEAESKEQVLKTLGQAATELRARLGESLRSIQQFDQPLEQATTSSLDALKAYSQGIEQRESGKEPAAIPFFKRALELDPNFARAYAVLATAYYNQNSYELAEQFSTQAWSLRDRVSEREHFYLSQQYYRFVLGDLEKSIETLELWKRTYPRDYLPLSLSGSNYSALGQYERSAEEARASLQIHPKNAIAHNNLASDLINLNRFDEAQKMLEQALTQKLENFQTHASLRALAFLQGDQAAVRQQDEWAKGKPVEPYMLGEQAATAGIAGQLRQARATTSRGIAMLAGKDNEVAGRWAFISAMREAAYGNCAPAKSDAAKVFTLARNRYQLGGAAVALALCGEALRAQQIVDDAAQRFPQDTLIQSLFRPGVLAAIELTRNNPRRAVELLEPSRRYETGTFGFFWPVYLRGLAYLQQRAGREAAREFQRLLDHKGFVVRHNVSPPLALAQLGLARALVLMGDTANARQAYDTLFTMWKDADPDLSALSAAKREAHQLR